MMMSGGEKLIVANWKASLTPVQADQWLADFRNHYQPVEGLRVVLAVPHLFLADLRKRFGAMEHLSWAVQDISPFPLGSYTGSNPAAWLTGLVEYALVGHRERRRYFHETIQDVANKVSEALEEEICPIVCVNMDIARPQSAAVGFEDMERLVVAYTPDDAEQLEVARGGVRLGDDVGRISAVFPSARILYGGGVTADNVAGFFSLPQLGGVMVAGGCLDPRSFARLVENAAASLGLE